MQRHSGRRPFVRTAAICGAAISVGLKARAAGSNDRIAIGVMGLGRGNAVAQTFARQPNVVVKYLCDVDADRATVAAAAVGKLGGSPQIVGDFRRTLDDKSVDALVCAAPNHWHGPATILACQAGKHVYVEKPCSHTPAEGEWMMAAADRHRRVIQVGTQRRSQPQMIEAIQLLRDGAIGNVYHARAVYASRRGSIGRGMPVAVPKNLDYELWQGPALRRPYLSNVVHYNWHWRWHWGNGELGNNGVHTLDLCRWGLNVDYPTRVVSSGGRYCFEDDQETPDTQVVAFEFNGKKSISWEGTSCNAQPQGFVTFIGANGAIAVDGDCGYTLTDDRGRTRKKVQSKLDDAHHAANFLAALRADRPQIAQCGIVDGHKAALLCHLGNIAQRTGKAVVCDPKNGRPKDSDLMAHWTKQYEPKWQPTVA